MTESAELGVRPPYSRRFWLSLLPAFAVGLALRLYRLREQVLTGDEWHAVEAALEWSASEIVRTWTYYGADYGIPLALLDRAGIAAGIAMGELSFRLPALLSGIALLALAPICLAGRIGGRAAIVLAWLIAISPLLTLYSRIARAYMPVALLGFVAVACFEQWLRTRSRAAAFAYPVLVGLTAWLHLPAVTYVLAPLAFGVLRIVFDWRQRRHELGGLIALGLAAGVAILCVLLPARESLVALTQLHGGGGLPSPQTWLQVIRLHSGTTNIALTAIVVAATLRGAWLLWRRDAQLALYWIALPALLVAGLIVLGPDQLENPIVINRYLIIALPTGLAFTAVGLASPWRAVESTRARRLGRGAVGVVILACFATGPFIRQEFRTSSFLSATTFVMYATPGNRIPLDQAPAFYRELVSPPLADSVRPIVEYPWVNITTHAFDAYQKIHRRPLLAGVLASDGRLALRNEVGPAPDDLLASNARFFILHRDLQREAARVLSTDPHHWRRADIRGPLASVWERLRQAAPLMEASLRKSWGAPRYQDSEVRVWDLDAVRAKADASR